MNKTKQFALHFAAVALLVGTSAFADSRPSDATARDRGSRHDSNRGSQQRDSSRSYQRGDSSRSFAPQQRNETRNWDRSNNQNRSFQRDTTRSYDNRSYSPGRSYDRGYVNGGTVNRGYVGGTVNRGYVGGTVNRGNAYYHDGRISRIERWNGGYRVYVGGALYPFFIPEARFNLFNWRVGLSIHVGGFYNPLGYYDYYDGAYPYGGYPSAYVGVAPSAAELRGIVDNVDYRRGSMVIRDDASGSFVTVMMRGDDPRFDSVRVGDSVDLSGDWVRGYFEAFRLDRVDSGYDNGYYRR